jgi:GNAT superfamily N-acetyltransferase
MVRIVLQHRGVTSSRAMCWRLTTLVAPAAERKSAVSGRSALWWLIDEASTVRELAASVAVGRWENGRVSDYRLSEDPTDLDMDSVVRWISTDAYWAKGRTREVIERSFVNSVPVGLYTPGGTQAAVARIVSDRATFAWLCDVYVDRDHRGRGLGTMLADWTVTWAERHEIKRIMLATLDAHGVYAKAGFAPVGHPERWMEIDRRPPFG